MTTVRRLAIALLSVLALIGMVGCDPTPVIFKTVAVGAPLVAGGYRALDAADSMEQAKVRARVQGGDVEGAKAELAAHLKRYDAAALALDTTTATMQTALDSVPVIRAARDKKASLALVAQLLELYTAIKAALLPFGVDISFGGL